MALYLGSSEKLRVNVAGITVRPHIVVVEKDKLLSSDRYILKDVNGLYIKAKDGE